MYHAKYLCVLVSHSFDPNYPLRNHLAFTGRFMDLSRLSYHTKSYYKWKCMPTFMCFLRYLCRHFCVFMGGITCILCRGLCFSYFLHQIRDVFQDRHNPFDLGCRRNCVQILCSSNSKKCVFCFVYIYFIELYFLMCVMWYMICFFVYTLFWVYFLMCFVSSVMWFIMRVVGLW